MNNKGNRPSLGGILGGHEAERKAKRKSSKKHSVPMTTMNNFSLEKRCYTTPNSTLSGLIKDIIETSSVGNTKKDKSDVRIPRVSKNASLNFRVDMYGNYIYEYKTGKSSYDVTVKNADRILTARDSTNMRKVLNFLLQKANQQSSEFVAGEEIRFVTFDLQEVVDRGMYASKDAAIRGLDRILMKLSMIEVGGTLRIGGKTDTLERYGIVKDRKLSRSKPCMVEVGPRVFEHLSKYYTALPAWADRLKGKSYPLLDYVYMRARQLLEEIEEKEEFTIKFGTLSRRLGFPSTEDVSDHSNMITKPLIKAIDDVEEELARVKNNYPDAMSLQLTPVYNHNYVDGREFLSDGYLIVKLDKETTDYFASQSKQHKKKIQGQQKKKEA